MSDTSYRSVLETSKIELWILRVFISAMIFGTGFAGRMIYREAQFSKGLDYCLKVMIPARSIMQTEDGRDLRKGK